MVDVAIIGAGPAGIAAALNVRLRNMSLMLFGARARSQKLASAKLIHNYPGFAGISGEALAAAYQKHIEAEGISVTTRVIDHVYQLEDMFYLASGDEGWEARAVVLATGVSFEHPLPGEEEIVGEGVSYCATCDGRLYKGANVLVLGYDDKSIEEALYLSELARVTYMPITKAADTQDERLQIIRDIKPSAISRRAGQTVLATDKGEFMADCAFILRGAISPNLLVAGLDAPDGHVSANKNAATNVKGLFAAGDVTGTPYQIAKAVGEGATAGLSAVAYVAAYNRSAQGKPILGGNNT